MDENFWFFRKEVNLWGILRYLKAPQDSFVVTISWEFFKQTSKIKKKKMLLRVSVTWRACKDIEI